MVELKGLPPRSLLTPGYHIQPEFDLKHLRQRMNSREEKDLDVVLPLTSMIDMFSLLVIFLLLNFSATGEAFFVNKMIELPQAEHAVPLESLPLISITQDKVVIDTEVVAENPATFTIDNWDMPKLEAALLNLKDIQERMKAAGLETKTQINIQADRNTEVVYIKRVMNALISQGFTGINFAVRERSGE